jgi:hypothetical protein
MMTTTTHIAHTTEINATTLATEITYEGMCAGLVRNDDMWYFEGTAYDTTATESHVLEVVGEALTEPERDAVAAARTFVFECPEITYTAQALGAMATAYAEECEGGEGVDAVVAILQEAARRVACVEALVI